MPFMLGILNLKILAQPLFMASRVLVVLLCCRERPGGQVGTPVRRRHSAQDGEGS